MLPQVSAQSSPYAYSITPLLDSSSDVVPYDLVAAGKSVFWLGAALNDIGIWGYRIDDEGRASQFLYLSLSATGVVTSSPFAKLIVNTNRFHIYIRGDSKTNTIGILTFSDSSFTSYSGVTYLGFNNQTAGPVAGTALTDSTLFVGSKMGSIFAINLDTLQSKLFLGANLCAKATSLTALEYSTATSSLLLACDSGPSTKISVSNAAQTKLPFRIGYRVFMRSDNALWFRLPTTGYTVTVAVTYPSNNYATYCTVNIPSALCDFFSYSDMFLSSNQIDLLVVCYSVIYFIDGNSLSLSRISLPPFDSRSMYFVSVSKYRTSQGYPIVYTMIQGALIKINGSEFTQILPWAQMESSWPLSSPAHSLLSCGGARERQP